MVRKVFLNGQVRTLLVLEDQQDEPVFNPILETLSEQAERIASLEAQNRELIRQEEILIQLVEITTQTGELMSRSLRALKKLEESLQSEELLAMSLKDHDSE